MNHTPFLVADGLHSLTACRVDQLDKCNECDSPVLRREERCGYCKSTDIKINRYNKKEGLQMAFYY